MKCPHCDTMVVKIPANWKCPHCSERLPEPSKWFRFVEGMTEYLQDKGAIFWSIAFGFLLIAIGVGEMLWGFGFLLEFIGLHIITAIGGIFFGGMLINMYVKVVLPLRLPFGGSSFLMRERVVIRNMRKGTHVALLAGILACIFIAGPRIFLVFFPAYLIIIGWFLALAWSLSGLFINPRWLEDVRFRHFLDHRLGILSLKKYRKLGTIFIAVLIITVILYFVLLQVPDIWGKIENSAIIGSTILLLKTYFSWLG